MIYKIIKKDTNSINYDSTITVEYAVTKGGNIYIFTEDDVDPEIVKLSKSLLLESKSNNTLGSYPPINVKYSRKTYKVQLIPESDFKANHGTSRVKISGGISNQTRHISFSNDDPICKRGAISIYATKTKKFDYDPKIEKSIMMDVAKGFIYATIDDLEDYYNGKIYKNEMQKIADEKYSNIPKAKQDKYNKTAEKYSKG